VNEKKKRFKRNGDPSKGRGVWLRRQKASHRKSKATIELKWNQLPKVLQNIGFIGLVDDLHERIYWMDCVPSQ
jgi:hypothetical protein